MSGIIKILMGAVLLFMVSSAFANDPVENDNDLSVQSLRIVLGDVVNIMTGEPTDNVDRDETVITKLFYAWNQLLFAATGLLSAYVMGSWFMGAIHGKKQNNDDAFIPFRILLALTLSAPMVGSFTLAQNVHLYMVGHSIGIGNSMAGIIYDNHGVGGVGTTSGSSPTDLYAAAAYYESAACVQATKAIYDDANAAKITDEEDVNMSGDIIKSYEYIRTYGGDSIPWPIGSPISADGCGEYIIEYEEPDEEYSDGSAESTYYTRYVQLHIALANNAGILATQLVNEILKSGASKESNDLMAHSHALQLKSLQYQFNQDMVQIQREYAEDYAQFLGDNPGRLEGYGLFEPKHYGWIALGAMYWSDSAKTMHLNNTIKSISFEWNAAIDNEIIGNEDFHVVWQSIYLANRDIGGLDRMSGQMDPEYAEDMVADSMEFFIGRVRSIVVEGDDPVFSIMELGHEMIVLAEVMIAILALFEALGGTATAIITAAGTAVAGPAGAVAGGAISGLIASLGKALYALVPLLLGLGMYYAYWIPSLPLMHWVGNVVGVLIRIIETTLLLPVHVMSHLFGGDQRMISQRAMAGYGMLLGAYLSVPILVIGYAIAYMLMLVGGKIIFTLFFPFVNAMSATTVTGIVGMIGLTFVLSGFIVALIDQVFKWMTDLNDKAVRIIGVSSESVANMDASRGSGGIDEVRRDVGQSGAKSAGSDNKGPSVGTDNVRPNET